MSGAAQALRTMLQTAARDPLWAVSTLVLRAVRGGRYLVFALLATALIGLVLFAAVSIGLSTIGWQNTALHLAANIAVVLVMVALLARLLLRPVIEHFGDTGDDTTHGTAQFASDRDVRTLTTGTTGLLVGRDTASGRLLRYDGPAHLLTMAPTRTGKGVGTLIPNLLTADRSIVCIDPKGENARVTARARDAFGKLHILDPFGVTGQRSASFNPLADLDPNGLDAAEEAASLADALVYDPPGEAGEAHWNEEAKALIGGLILFVAAEEPDEQRTLATLREHLTLAPDAFTDLLARMQKSPAASGLVARAANRHRAKSDREAAGVLSAAQRHTHFLDSPRMTHVLGRSDFDFVDLKRRTATIFLVLPPDRLATYARWLRLVLTRSLADMARSAIKPSSPVLYLLDEFAALGRLDPIEHAMGLMAGYGLQLWPILQDVHQLRATYGPKAGTFLANAGVLQVFGVNDHDSARLVSDLLGQGTVVFQTISRALDAQASGLTLGEQHVGRSLLTPDEIRTLPGTTELLFLAGQRPIRASKLRYYDDPEFRGLFDRA